MLWEDNAGCIAVAEGNAGKGRTKHIALKHHYVRECERDRFVILKKVKSEFNCADMLTKSLGKNEYKRHVPEILQVIINDKLNDQAGAALQEVNHEIPVDGKSLSPGKLESRIRSRHQD